MWTITKGRTVTYVNITGIVELISLFTNRKRVQNSCIGGKPYSNRKLDTLQIKILIQESHAHFYKD